MDHVKGFVPSASLVQHDAGNLVIVLPFDSTADLPPLLDALEVDATGMVSEWGVSFATLEEVFLHITASSGFELSANAMEGGNTAEYSAAKPAKLSSQPQRGVGEGGPQQMPGARALSGVVDSRPDTSAASGRHKSRSSGSNTTRALWRKNLTLQKRQKGQCCCQIFTPVTVMALLIVLQCVHGDAVVGWCGCTWGSTVSLHGV